MEKSCHEKKKSGAGQNQAIATTGEVVLENAHAHELEEEGNKMFKSKEQTLTSNNSEKLYPVSPIQWPDIKTRLPKVILNPSNGYSLPKLKDNQLIRAPQQQAPIKFRPLKLVNNYATINAQLPDNSSFKVLRGLVGKHYPKMKAVLIKYKDSDGDLVTITCSSDLRLAESLVDNKPNIDEKRDSTLSMLRLYIVGVNPEQEPPLLENEEEDEVEMDDWLFDFAQIFRTHVEIDPDSHIDLHKVRFELLYKALRATVTREEAQTPFDKAASKFEEVAASAFFNLGNVHMCAAQKRMPVDESGPKETMDYESVREKYKKAKRNYKKALLMKPDFFEGLLALAQQQFEMANLHWRFVLGKNSDVSEWDITKTLCLLDSAERNMEAAAKMWEKMEEQRANESNQDEKDEVEVTPEEAAEQAAVLRSQIHLIWGNMLYKRSQIESSLGLLGSAKNRDAAVESWKLVCKEKEKVDEVMVEKEED